MNDNNYGKGNGQYNNQYGGLDEDYFDYGTNDGFDNNNYYQNQGNYTVPLDGDLSNSSFIFIVSLNSITTSPFHLKLYI